MEVCAGFERIAIENTTTRGDDLLEIGKGREAQMIGHMRHGSPPRLMAPQSVRSADLREFSPPPFPRRPSHASSSRVKATESPGAQNGLGTRFRCKGLSERQGTAHPN